MVRKVSPAMAFDRLGHAMAASKRSGRCAALLVEVARRIEGCVREMDTVARFGGDEFVVMLDQLSCDAQEAALVAAKIRAALSEPYRLTLAPPGANLPLIEHRCTASIGLTLFRSHETSKDEVLRQADRAMYHAKAAGGDRFCSADVVTPPDPGA